MNSPGTDAPREMQRYFAILHSVKNVSASCTGRVESQSKVQFIRGNQDGDLKWLLSEEINVSEVDVSFKTRETFGGIRCWFFPCLAKLLSLVEDYHSLA